MPRKLLTEALGTFFLVLTIALAVGSGSPLAPLAIGAVLMAMVYMGGHVSGAHYNPAVTLAVLIRGKATAREAGAYVVAQLAGAILASLAAFAVTGQALAPAPAPGASPVAVLLVEALFTFGLALVVLNVATTRANDGNSFYGLAIGFTVAAGAVAGGSISGGAFNPAVGVGMSLVQTVLDGGSLAAVWYYLVGPLTGAAAAALVFRAQNPAEHAPAPVHFTGVARPENSRPEAAHPADATRNA